MAVVTKTPGVYIEEISVFPPSVAPVATAIPAFIGFTEKAGPSNSLLNTAVRITSMGEFEDTFGKAFGENFNITVVDSPIVNPTSRTVTATLAAPSDYKLYYSLQMYFANGGGPCYIIAVGIYGTSITQTPFINALPVVAKEDEPTLILFPDATALGSPLYGNLVSTSLALCNKLKDRFVIADTPTATTLANMDSGYRTDLGSNNLKYGASYFPYINSLLNFGVDGTQTIDSYTGTESGITGVPLNTLKTSKPSLYNSIIAEITRLFVTLPPSGAIAGIYASVDRDRGVWKAPANVSINAVSGPSVLVTAQQQEDLNVDATSGKSINVIRAFTGKGTLVWGARTLAGNDNEWRYVPVRRLFIFAEESIKKATEFVVFEPNDRNTWLRVQTLIGNFLTNLWREGALAGATPDEAFFIRVGLGDTMTAQDILEGKLIIQVGLAAVRPAEFIILQFMHKLQES
jgi:phage tail sheath protein FI